MEFQLGNIYSREQISAVLGGDLQSYLPRKDGRVVYGAFNKKKNPDAPQIILVGTGTIREKSAKQLAKQGGNIPVFVKQASKEWKYCGLFSVKHYSNDPLEIRRNEEISKRENLTAVIYLESVE